jgi:hypothetical protein
MVDIDPQKAAQLYAMASNFRHVADGTELPGYRERLLKVARDLEREAAKLEDQSILPPDPGKASRAR